MLRQIPALMTLLLVMFFSYSRGSDKSANKSRLNHGSNINIRLVASVKEHCHAVLDLQIVDAGTRGSGVFLDTIRPTCTPPHLRITQVIALKLLP